MRLGAIVGAGIVTSTLMGSGGLARDKPAQFSLDANRVEIASSVTDRRGHFVARGPAKSG